MQKRTCRRNTYRLILAGLGALSASTTFGATKSWVAGDGNWSTAGKWLTSGAPGASDDIVFNSGGVSANQTVTVDVNPNITNLTTFNNSGTSLFQNDLGNTRTIATNSLTEWRLLPTSGNVTIQSNPGGGTLSIGANAASSQFTMSNNSESLLTISTLISSTNTSGTRNMFAYGSGAIQLNSALGTAGVGGSFNFNHSTSSRGSTTIAGTNSIASRILNNGGTLTLTGTVATPELYLTGGQTVIDYTNGNNRLSNSSVIVTTRGGTVAFNGAANTASTQTIASILPTGGGSTLFINKGAGTGTMTVAMTGDFGSRTTGSLLLDLSGGGTLNAPSVTLPNGIVGQSGIIVKDSTSAIGFAARDGSNNIIRYTGATALSGSQGASLNTSTNFAMTNTSATLFATTSQALQQLNSLRIIANTSGQSLNLNQRNLFAVRGILFDGSQDFTISNGYLGATASEALVMHHGTGILTIGATVGNGGGTNIFTKAGPGTVVLTAANTNTGITNVVGGVLEGTISGTPSLSATSCLQLVGGILQSSGDFTRSLGTAGGNVRWADNSGDVDGGIGGGFSARTNTLNIRLNNGTNLVTWGDTSFVQPGRALVFGSSTADNMVDFKNLLGLGNYQREIRVNDNTSSTGDFTRFSNTISSTGGGLLKSGTGLLELTANNTYTGETYIAGGNLKVTGSLTSSTIKVQNTGTLSGEGSTSGAVTVASGGTFAPGASPGNFTVGGNLTLSGNYAWEFDNAGVINDGVTSDQIDVNGSSVVLGGSLNVSLTTGDYTSGFWNSNRTWKIIDGTNATATTGSFSSITASGSTGEGSFTFNSSNGDTFLNWTAAASSTISLTVGTAEGSTNRADNTPASDLNQTVAGAVTISGSGNNFTSEIDDLQNVSGSDDYNMASATLSQTPGSPIYAMFWLTGEDATSLAALRSELDALTDVEAYTLADQPGVGSELTNFNFLAANYAQYGGWDLLVKLHDSAIPAGATSLNWNFANQSAILVDKIAVVPEPATPTLLAAATSGLLLRRRRRMN